MGAGASTLPEEIDEITAKIIAGDSWTEDFANRFRDHCEKHGVQNGTVKREDLPNLFPECFAESNSQLDANDICVGNHDGIDTAIYEGDNGASRRSHPSSPQHAQSNHTELRGGGENSTAYSEVYDNINALQVEGEIDVERKVGKNEIEKDFPDSPQLSISPQESAESGHHAPGELSAINSKPLSPGSQMRSALSGLKSKLPRRAQTQRLKAKQQVQRDAAVSSAVSAVAQAARGIDVDLEDPLPPPNPPIPAASPPRDFHAPSSPVPAPPTDEPYPWTATDGAGGGAANITGRDAEIVERKASIDFDTAYSDKALAGNSLAVAF